MEHIPGERSSYVTIDQLSLIKNTGKQIDIQKQITRTSQKRENLCQHLGFASFGHEAGVRVASFGLRFVSMNGAEVSLRICSAGSLSAPATRTTVRDSATVEKEHACVVGQI